MSQHRHQGPAASETLYVEALAARDTINSIPENTLRAFADQGVLAGTIPEDRGDVEAILTRFTSAGVDIGALALQLQRKRPSPSSNPGDGCRNASPRRAAPWRRDGE